MPLLLADTQESACEQAGVARSTLFGWMKEERFANALESARNELFDSAMHQLKATLEKAVRKITALMDGAKKEDVQLRAAALIVEHAIKIRQVEELERRLEILERALARQ